MPLESAPRSNKNKAATQDTHSEHTAREQRLEMALRANLKRRKAQARTMAQSKPKEDSPDKDNQA